MKALQLLAHGKPGTFEVREIPDLPPGPDEVVVKVRACGLNHLDLWTEAGELPVPIKLPLTPGCEISGEVLRIGEGVAPFKPGDRVAIQSNLFAARANTAGPATNRCASTTSYSASNATAGWLSRL